MLENLIALILSIIFLIPAAIIIYDEYKFKKWKNSLKPGQTLIEHVTINEFLPTKIINYTIIQIGKKQIKLKHNSNMTHEIKELKYIFFNYYPNSHWIINPN